MPPEQSTDESDIYLCNSGIQANQPHVHLLARPLHDWLYPAWGVRLSLLLPDQARSSAAYATLISIICRTLLICLFINTLSFILASNRDEYYRRPSLNIGPWNEDPHVIGGRDLEANCGAGSWLAFSPLRKKLGVLLNLPRTPNPDAKSRGRLVADFVKCDTPVKDYVDGMKSYVSECNEFVFIAVELRDLVPSIHTYSNDNDKFITHTDKCLGFGNSLPETPLKKVEAGTSKLLEICSRLNKVEMKQELVNELLSLLKSEERYLPDPELEKRRSALSKYLSSIFVCIPEGGYGTRTHTLMLVTKTGEVDVIEISLQSPIDIQNPNWHRTELKIDLNAHL